MAHLRNLEVAVDYEKNRRVGTGRSKTSPHSCYLRVGGSRDVYSVTLNWNRDPKLGKGHFCATEHDGKPCPGNTFSMKKRWGAIIDRDRNAPHMYCKHVKGALADIEAIAEAQEIRAQAFGTVATPEPVIEPKPAPVVAVEPEQVKTAAERLAELDRERAELAEELAAEERAECFAAVAELEKRFGYSLVREALRAA